MFQGHIFGIGLSKTGTHTLNRCLEILGYRTIHFPDPALMAAGEFEKALAGCNAATDISVAAYFDILDRKYPGSQFILTVREMDAWLGSVEDGNRIMHEGRASERAPLLERLFGVRDFDRRAYARGYDTHLARVRAHFSQRRDDLLELDVCGRPEWGALCNFLKTPVPREAFPWLNRAAA